MANVSDINSSTGEKLFSKLAQAQIYKVNNRYDKNLARSYFEKHTSGFFHRLSNLWEQRMATRALVLAGEPKVILDLPCGAGRFWKLLARKPGRQLIAADYSLDMINTALNFQPWNISQSVESLQISAFDIALSEGSVDCIFCMRLLHHISSREARAKILQEFHRVSRDTVCLSLWVDGNIQAFRRRTSKKHHRHNQQSYTRFLVSCKQIESEFRQAGFEIKGYVDLMPLFSMWRTYVLKRRQVNR
jgi:ubiquinone/menaquinone biosynthesis C-methylase UbiE